MTTSTTNLEPTVVAAVRDFARRLAAAHYPVQQVIVFGSHARGTQRKDSDVDVAVLLQDSRDRFIDIKLEMVDIAYDVLLETWLDISPLPIWKYEWEHPESHSNPYLLHDIKREGMLVEFQL